MIPLPPKPTLFPYTTLFRSKHTKFCFLEADRSVEFVTGDQSVINLGKTESFGLYYPLTPTREIGKHTSELQSRFDLVCRLLLEKKKKKIKNKQHKTALSDER